MSTLGSSSGKNKRKNALGNRTDPGWEHAIDVDSDAKKVKCKYCGVVRSGGIFRLKHHLAGTRCNVEACLQVPDDVKHKFRALLEASEKQAKRKKAKFGDIGEEDRRNYSQSSGGIQTTLNQKYKKEDREEVCQQIARFLYTSAIPFNVVVEKVGEENVVQVVTDNAANYKAAGEKLMEKRTRLFWTPCAAHCIDLMLEDLDKKIKVHTTTIAKARKISTYIYSRTLLLTWMREFTKGRELIRPGVTRFATSYLTLKSLNDQKGPLFALFASDKWKNSKFAKSIEGKKIQRVALDGRGFWHGVVSCLKAALPIVKVLRLVDSDEHPAMGFIYEAMAQAKIQIRENFNNVEKNYKPILDIVDERWADQLHRPLHAAAYYLNPQYQYGSNFQGGADIKIGLYNCLQRMVPDVEERTLIDLQMDAFKHARGLFGLPTAVATRCKKAPADWWDSYGDECPELKKFAIRILSLTCSSSGCERNWSAFEMVHTKKRNRLHQDKMNDLVFVMYNLKLKRRHMQRASTHVIQPLVLDDLPSDDEWITEEEEPVLPTDDSWINDLDRAARRLARETEQVGSLDVDTNLDDNNPQDEIADDNEVDGTFVDSNEVEEDDDDVQMGATPTTTGTDMENDDFDACTNFGFDE